MPSLPGKATPETQESREYPHRIGHYPLRHKFRIIALLKIDDKSGDKRVAVRWDSGRERLPAALRLAQAGNAAIRSQGKDAARMEFINGLLRGEHQ